MPTSLRHDIANLFGNKVGAPTMTMYDVNHYGLPAGGSGNVTNGLAPNGSNSASLVSVDDVAGALSSGLHTSTDSNILNYNSAEKIMDYNSKEAQKNRDWQKMMSDTQYQRMIADLKKAGINPLMAFNGLGSTSYIGASASSTNQQYTNDDAIIGSIVSALGNLLGNVIGSALKLVGMTFGA